MLAHPTNMEDADLRCLEIEQNYSDISRILERFVINNAQTFSFESFHKSEKHQKLFNVIFKLLANQEASVCHKDCLESLRILRDKRGLNEVLDESKISILLALSSIYKAEEAAVKYNENNKTDIVVASLKVLCNLVYNSTVATKYVSQSHAAQGILMRLRMYREARIAPIIKLFDIKLLFLITALSPEIRPKIKYELHGLVYLTEALDLILKESPPKNDGSHYVKLSDNNVDLCCELLKVIFNLMAKNYGLGTVMLVDEDEEETVCVRLTFTVHDLLLAEASPQKKEELQNHTVNLLTSIPSNCYTEMMTVASEDLPKDLEWEGKNMEVIDILLNFLDQKLAPNEFQKSKNKLELLSPILTVLLQMSRHQRIIRKFLRHKILPPLKDVMSRPEEGDSMRAKLCRLLTSPSSTVKDLTAEFLFALCKENVGRMIKYTGYGNAAGLFANRGMMFGANQCNSSQSSYSSDSDSETEEYAKYSDQINPVTGCYEPPRLNPMEGMTEEQKEYEAVQLANMLDKLSREGIIQPCQVGEDGRPKPVEHILQLQENLPSQQVRTAEK